MKKGIGVAFAAFVAAVVMGSALFFFSESRYQPIDEMVENFIIGKVEGNDDLLASVLTEDAQGIIIPGRHAYPGAAETMGNRYEIVRFPHRYKEGVMIYEITFFRPSTGKLDHYNVLVLNKHRGWKIAKNSDFDESWMTDEIDKHNGKIVHRYGEVKE